MFVHLHVHTEFSFLDGGSTIDQLVRRASELGMPFLAMTDHNSLAGAVKFVAACDQFYIHPILGSELTMEDGSHLTLLAENREGYANLCRLISTAFEAGGRLTPALPWSAIGPSSAGLICLTGCRKGKLSEFVRRGNTEAAESLARKLLDWFGSDNLFLELQDDWMPDSRRVCADLVALGRRMGVACVATNNVHYADREGYIAHDLLRCISAGTTFATPHPDRPLNRERFLKSAPEMHDTFRWCPEALRMSVEIAERCANVLPKENITPLYTAGNSREHLRQATIQGVRERYPRVTPRIVARVNQELEIINRLGFSDYMLVCRDIVHWARTEQNIRCTGRGSAADSIVAYALRLTDVDVVQRNLPFARFLTEGKTPDIDCDFPSSRRDEVFRYVQRQYQPDRVAMVCTFFTFHARSAVRDIGKVMGLPPDMLAHFSERLHHFVRADQIEAAFSSKAELRDQQHLMGRFQTLMTLCAKISGFPRHIGTHSSGVLISRIPLTQVAPVVPSAKGILPILTLDKDDAEEVGGIKFDVLALRTLSAVADAEEDIQRRDSAWRYDAIPDGDRATFDMLQRGRAIGAFQLESAAQIALAVTMLPNSLKDIEEAVAMIRPANNRSGAVLQNTVQRYLNARSGYQPIDYVHPRLKPVLASTCGCVLFQEQVDHVIRLMTGWDEPASENFRKSLAKHNKNGTLVDAGEIFVRACLEYDPRLGMGRALLLWQDIQGWGSYGFTHGHAASFALTAYRTSWLSVNEVAAYFAGLMNHQPMGFYPSNTLAAEARRRGATILPVDINESDDKCQTVAAGKSIQLGLRIVSGLGEAEIESLVAERETNGPFVSLLDFCVRVVMRRDTIENLILSGAFDRLHRHRRGLMLKIEETLALAATFRASAIAQQQTAFGFTSRRNCPTPCADTVADFSAWDRLMWTWRTTGICADAHPLAFLRPDLAARGVMTVREALAQPAKTLVKVAGLNIRPHRPPTRTGRKVLFTTVEDETDFAQTLSLDDAIERCTATFLLSPAAIIDAIVERRGNGASLLVQDARPLRLEELRK